MFKSLSTSLLVRGVLAVAAGITALAWPQVTVLALVTLFAVYALSASGLEIARAFGSATAGRRPGTCCPGWPTWPPGWSRWPGRGRPRSCWC